MLRQWIGSYAKVLDRRGRPLARPGRNWGVLRNIYVAPTMEEARRDYEPALMGSLRYRAADPWRALRAHLDPGEEPAPGNASRLGTSCRAGVSLPGPPDHVAETIVELGGLTGAETLLVGIGTRGLAQEKVMRCLELFSERVIPQVERELETPATEAAPAEATG